MVRPEKHPDKRLPPGCEQVPVGLTDVEKLTGIVAGCKAIIYCAGSVRGRSSADFAYANIDGVQAMLDALQGSGTTPPMLLLSSLAASRPKLSDYAYSKYAGEQLLCNKAHYPWTILRPPAVYGPGDREMLPLLKMIRRGLLAHAGPVDQRLSFLHVDDLTSAMISWLSSWENCLHETYAIDDGKHTGYDWNEIGGAVSDKRFRVLKVPDVVLKSAAGSNLFFSKILGYSPMLSPGKVRELIQTEWLCDNRAFSAATGWKPRLDLKQGTRLLFKA